MLVKTNGAIKPEQQLNKIKQKINVNFVTNNATAKANLNKKARNVIIKFA